MAKSEKIIVTIRDADSGNLLIESVVDPADDVNSSISMLYAKTKKTGISYSFIDETPWVNQPSASKELAGRSWDKFKMISVNSDGEISIILVGISRKIDQS